MEPDHDAHICLECHSEINQRRARSQSGCTHIAALTTDHEERLREHWEVYLDYAAWGELGGDGVGGCCLAWQLRVVRSQGKPGAMNPGRGPVAVAVLDLAVAAAKGLCLSTVFIQVD